jgi:hypothetical protein
MQLFFIVLSTAYVSGIFLLADSSIVSGLASYNPHSLLHIPLYGILTLLLFLSFQPGKGIRFRRGTRRIARNLTEPDHPVSLAVRIDPMGKIGPAARLMIAGFVAAGIAIADEVHQSSILTRHASISDVFLDIIGISIVIFCVRRLCRKQS